MSQKDSWLKISKDCDKIVELKKSHISNPYKNPPYSDLFQEVRRPDQFYREANLWYTKMRSKEIKAFRKRHNMEDLDRFKAYHLYVREQYLQAISKIKKKNIAR